MIRTSGRRCVCNCLISTRYMHRIYPYSSRGTTIEIRDKKETPVNRNTPIRYAMHNTCIYNDLCHTRHGEKTSGAKAQEWCLLPSILFQGEQKNLHHLVSFSETVLQRQTIFSRSGNKSRSRSRSVQFVNSPRSN